MPACCSTSRSCEATGAEGVGLFRTEIPLLARDAFPDVAEQTAFYRRVYEQAGDRPVVFRTLDIGGDKVLPYLAAHRRGQSGDGLAGDPHRARPPGHAAPAIAGADARRRAAATSTSSSR